MPAALSKAAKMMIMSDGQCEVQSSRSCSLSQSIVPCGSYTGSTSVAEMDEEGRAKVVLAERYKTKYCNNFVINGACPYDTRCMFAHSAEELRTAEMNIADGLITMEAIRRFQRLLHQVTRSSRFARLRPVRTSAPWAMVPAASTGPAAMPHAYHDLRQSSAKGICERAGCAAAATPMAGVRYTHNPYRCDILPLLSRLYSKLPDMFVVPCNRVPDGGSELAQLPEERLSERILDGDETVPAFTERANAQQEQLRCDSDARCREALFLPESLPSDEPDVACTPDSGSEEVDGEVGDRSVCSSIGNESGDVHNSPTYASHFVKGSLRTVGRGVSEESSHTDLYL
ncbi:unnamed protein product [Trypanosoma congolense IL3000]|uniref:WGS project CAEQ00000000 data, annotated contig 689 n=1 Tax=Trypanosoma congolense (strain IL3000) TaxID=1068625 RepID=F9WHS1_TRYCI|nr:unnamed protein product [Trypanosoma congolense IL3000]